MRPAYLFVALIALLVLPAIAPAAFIPVAHDFSTGSFIGSRSASVPGEVVATDGWQNNFVFKWDIAFIVGVGWEYKYWVDPNGGKEVSHFILETSPTFTSANILNKYGFTISGPDTWAPGGSDNPNMPGPLYGIKFDDGQSGGAGVVGNPWKFLSNKMPIWGSFYTKDGKDDNQVVATAWNAGFLSDPTTSTTDFSNWVPVPDSDGFGNDVPEPASMIALVSGGLCAAGALGLRRRRAMAGKGRWSEENRRQILSIVGRNRV